MMVIIIVHERVSISIARIQVQNQIRAEYKENFSVLVNFGAFWFCITFCFCLVVGKDK